MPPTRKKSRKDEELDRRKRELDADAMRKGKFGILDDALGRAPQGHPLIPTEPDKIP